MTADIQFCSCGKPASIAFAGAVYCVACGMSRIAPASPQREVHRLMGNAMLVVREADLYDIMDLLEDVAVHVRTTGKPVRELWVALADMVKAIRDSRIEESNGAK